MIDGFGFQFLIIRILHDVCDVVDIYFKDGNFKGVGPFEYLSQYFSHFTMLIFIKEFHEFQCKKIIFMYGPFLLGNIQQMLNENDLCNMMGMCKDPLPIPSPPPQQRGNKCEMLV